MNGVSYDVPWMRKDRWLVEATPGPCFPCQSLTLTPPRLMYIRLSVTFVTPVSHCSVCDVDEAFSGSGSYTIFEVDGRFDGNLESRIRLVGVKPVFMKYAVDKKHERRQVFLEFETLLDHLFRHMNTPAHVAKRGLLLLSLQTLQLPTFNLWWMPPKVEYDGKTYYGSLNDLGAMASLLHPEAKSSDVNAKYSGTLREPVVKVIHLVSSVEYRDAHDEPIVFGQLLNVFGQFTFLAPSVFNFYVSKVELLGVRG